MGRVYATAAVAHGRVFIGSLDGRVYAFSTRNGHRRWSHTTGSYVYASAAVSRGKVFVGSYDGRFYALSAKSGNVRWSHNTGGRISGSATVIGNIVYFSDLGHRDDDRAVDRRAGGARSTAARAPTTRSISDGKHLYLTAHHTLTALRPRKHHRR